MLDLRSLQGNGDAVQEDEGQNNIVKELVSNDGLAEDAEPAREFQKDPCAWGEIKLGMAGDGAREFCLNCNIL